MKGSRGQKKGMEVLGPGSGWQEAVCTVENVVAVRRGFCAREGLTGCSKTKPLRGGSDGKEAPHGTWVVSLAVICPVHPSPSRILSKFGHADLSLA